MGHDISINLGHVAGARVPAPSPSPARRRLSLNDILPARALRRLVLPTMANNSPATYLVWSVLITMVRAPPSLAPVCASDLQVLA